MRLVPGPQISGVVYSKQTGAPLAGVTVTPSQALYTTPEFTTPVSTLTTDGEGGFAAYAQPGVYTFAVSDPSGVIPEPVEVRSPDQGTSPSATAAGMAAAIAAEVARSNAAYLPASRSAFASLPATCYIAHRGDLAVSPENTMAAFRQSIMEGADGIKTDVQTLADSSLVIMHDTTTTRTTSTTGAVSTHNSGSWRNLVIPAGTNFAPAWSNQTPPVLEDFLNDFGGRTFIMLDPKDGLTSMPGIIAAVKRRGLQASVVITSSDSTLAVHAAAAAGGLLSDYQYAGSTISGLPTVAQAKTAGATSVSIGQANPDADITSVVSQAATAGIPVLGFNPSLRADMARFATLGITRMLCNDVRHCRGDLAAAPLTSDKIALGTPMPGMIYGPSGASYPPVPYVGSGTRLSCPASIATAYIGFGYMGPITATTYTIAATCTFDTLDGTTSRFAGVYVCSPDDMSYNGVIVQGYHCFIRQTGQMTIVKQIPGARVNGQPNGGTQATLADTGGTGITAITTPGQVVPLTVAVTPTTITFTRTDISQSIVGTDSAYRGGYLQMGKTGAGVGTMAVSWSTVTKT